MTRRWSEVRDRHVAAAGADLVVARSSLMRSRVRGHALAEVRRRMGLTQKQVAEAMGVNAGRISRIERGDPSDLDLLARDVQTLGGEVSVVATFGDEQLTIG